MSSKGEKVKVRRGRKEKEEKEEKEQKEAQLFESVKKTKYDNDEKAYGKVRAYMKSYIDLFCKKFIIKGLGVDDIEQECLFALRYKAIDDFNPKRGKFKTFAVLCIKRHLFSIIKGNNHSLSSAYASG